MRQSQISSATGWALTPLSLVLDLAARFADGRLSTRKLLEADDEELYRILTEVRGIGVVRPATSADSPDGR